MVKSLVPLIHNTPSLFDYFGCPKTPTSFIFIKPYLYYTEQDYVGSITFRKLVVFVN